MNRLQKCFTHSVVLTVIVSLTTLGMASAANGAIIGTEHMIRGEQRSAQLERVERLLLQDKVRIQLERAGVDPVLAAERARHLTSEELAILNEQLDALPHGGDILALIGAVFVVLLILELVGVTNIFNRV